MSQEVKAAVLTAPGKLEIQKFPYPSLKDGALLIKMEMSGICGTDKHTYMGEALQYAGTEAEINTPFPIIQGHENVGIIAEITQSAKNNIEFDGQKLKEGDRVVFCPDIVCGKCFYCRHSSGFISCENIRSYGNSFTCAEPPHLFGGWAEYIYIRPDVFVFKVSESISPQIAVLSELMAVAYNIDKAKEFFNFAGEGFGFGDTVVVQGVGPLGLIHVFKLRIMGADTIIAMDISSFRLEMAKQFGADFTLNVQDTTRDERIHFVKDLTDGRGADMVVECVGIPEVILEGIEMLRKGGMYIETGNFVEKGTISLDPHRHLCAKNIRLIGLTNHPPIGYKPSLRIMERYMDIYPLDKIVTHKFPIDKAEKAVKKSMEMDSMKVVIIP